MPNQLAKNKKRKSLAEHEAVLAALEEIAQMEGTSSMDLMRHAIRNMVKSHLKDNPKKLKLRDVVLSYVPKICMDTVTPAKLTDFKRQQREFDKLLLELNLFDPEGIESRNSVVSPKRKIRVLEFEK